MSFPRLPHKEEQGTVSGRGNQISAGDHTCGSAAESGDVPNLTAAPLGLVVNLSAVRRETVHRFIRGVVR